MATEFLNENTSQQSPPYSAPAATPLSLENGDRLTRAEFERRYHAMPELKKAQLVEGVVYMPSPVRFKGHEKPHSDIHGWLFNYAVATPGVEVADNITLRLDADNEPQPDLVLRIKELHGGRSSISEDGYLEGAPEMIVEIASSSASYDLHEKFKAYRRNGINEYLVWRVYDRQIDWFKLRDGEYVRLSPDNLGLIESEGFPGLRLKVEAILNGDLPAVLSALQEWLHSESHASFVQDLAGKTLK